MTIKNLNKKSTPQNCGVQESKISAVESESGAISGRGGNGLLTGDDGLLGSLDLLKGLSGDNVGGGGDAHAVVGEVVEMHAARPRRRRS